MSTLYKIKLQNFEGPLDLLLFFVRKDELNIYDIPLARITKSYLEYLQLMQDLNLDIASEFILMAATLMRIKVKMMLPKDPVAEDEEEMMDPREELSRRLIEYRQFKEASKSLSELDEYWRQVYRRSYFNFDLIPQNAEEVIGLKDISFFDLLAAYKKALEKKPIPVFHNVERLNVTVEEQQKYIMDFFRDRNCYLFTELCEDMAKIEIVVTFLALLDLVKRAEIAIKQASIFDDIWIYKASEFKEESIPEEERVNTEIRELTEAIETEQTIAESDSNSMADEIEADVSMSDTESELEDVSEEAPNMPNEIKVDFIENKVKTVDVTDESIQTDPVPHAHVAESFKETAGEEYQESELSTIEQESEPGSVDAETEHFTAAQSEMINVQVSDKIKNDETVDDLGAEVQNTVEASDFENMIVPSPELNDGQTKEEIQIIDPAIQEVSKELEPEETQIKTDSEIKKAEKDDQSLQRYSEPIEHESQPLTEKAEAEHKVSRWKTFLNKIVSIVRKMFSK